MESCVSQSGARRAGALLPPFDVQKPMENAFNFDSGIEERVSRPESRSLRGEDGILRLPELPPEGESAALAVWVEKPGHTP